MRISKIVCPFLCFLLCCGCSKSVTQNSSRKQEVGETIQVLQMEDRYLKSLQYPKTGWNELDQTIEKSVQTIEQAFLVSIMNKDYEIIPELNITYESYVKNDRYISVHLNIYQQFDEQKNTMETWIFDTEKKEFLTISNIIDNKDLQNLSKEATAYFKERYPKECNSDQFRSHISAAEENFKHVILKKDRFGVYFAAGTLFDHEAYFEMPYHHLETQISLQNEVIKTYVPYDDILNEPTKNIDPDKPMVALTFDDGPSTRYTASILDALKEYGASATFFVLGSNAERSPALLQRMVLEGNEIGNHTYSHKQLTTLSKENIEEEIVATQESIYGITHKYPELIRPPYGSKNDTVLQCTQGKRIVTWTLDTKDWKTRDSKAIVNYVEKTVKDRDIILMHDLYATSAQAAILLIPKLQEMGYQLVTVSELYAYNEQE